MTARSRFWIWYAAAWVPLGLFYTFVMWQTRSLPLATAVVQGTSYILPVAVLGVGVCWLTEKLDWPPRNLVGFVAIHVVAMVLFSAIWVCVEVSLIASGAGWRGAFEIAKQFIGFQTLDGLFFYGLIATGSHAIRIADRFREQEARAARAEALRMRAELAALRGQLNPHFLFNTLHTLTALVRRDPDTAERALERFGDMLRYVLDVKRSQREDVTLGDEMQFVRNYLSLEQLRFGDRLRVVEQIDPETLDCVLPSLTLQPLIENAIKHGIAPRASGGTLEILARFEEDSVAIEVRDDGSGSSVDTVESAAGVGLRASRQRLETRFPRVSDFSVLTAPGEGFVVRVTIPAQTSFAPV